MRAAVPTVSTSVAGRSEEGRGAEDHNGSENEQYFRRMHGGMGARAHGKEAWAQGRMHGGMAYGRMHGGVGNLTDAASM